MATSTPSEAQSAESQFTKRMKRGRVAGQPFPTRTVAPPSKDPLKAVMHEGHDPDMVLGKVRTMEGVQIVPVSKVADCPLNYLRYRTAPRNQIDDIQYAAAVRYREDVRGLARTGSNTAAIIDHMRTQPKLTAEDRRMLAAGEQFIKLGDDAGSKADASGKMLAAAFRVRRFDERLDNLEKSILNDLLVHERTVAQIGMRWGWQPEAASTVVRIVLWKLSNVSMEVDKEFCDWVASYRDATEAPLPKKPRKGT